jgi:hypothetical protein
MIDEFPIVPDCIWMELSEYKSSFIKGNIQRTHVRKHFEQVEDLSSEKEIEDDNGGTPGSIRLADVSIQM